MDISRSYNTKKLLEIVENYFSDNKNVSERAEISLLERNISGEELIDILNGSLNEREKDHEGKLQDKINRIEGLEKDYENLNLELEELREKYAQSERYREEYRPFIETFVSILEKAAKEEVRRLIKDKS